MSLSASILKNLKFTYIILTENMNKKKKIENKFNIWTPNLHVNLKPEKTDSWFTIYRYKTYEGEDREFLVYNEHSDNVTKCKKVSLHLTDYQKQVFNKWFDACTVMYNETLSFIKQYYETTGTTITNSRKIRSLYLKNKRDKGTKGRSSSKFAN